MAYPCIRQPISIAVGSVGILDSERLSLHAIQLSGHIGRPACMSGCIYHHLLQVPHIQRNAAFLVVYRPSPCSLLHLYCRHRCLHPSSDTDTLRPFQIHTLPPIHQQSAHVRLCHHAHVDSPHSCEDATRLLHRRHKQAHQHLHLRLPQRRCGDSKGHPLGSVTTVPSERIHRHGEDTGQFLPSGTPCV